MTLFECALGRYPYPPPGDHVHSLGFWELLEYIVVEPPPELPRERFSPQLCSFVAACLQKETKKRPTVAELQAHPFLQLHRGANLADLLNGGAAITTAAPASSPAAAQAAATAAPLKASPAAPLSS